MAERLDVRVAIMATDGFEESELTEPMRALREAGARVEVIAPRAARSRAFATSTRPGA
jgi:protease I